MSRARAARARDRGPQRCWSGQLFGVANRIRWVLAREGNAPQTSAVARFAPETRVWRNRGSSCCSVPRERGALPGPPSRGLCGPWGLLGRSLASQRCLKPRMRSSGAAAGGGGGGGVLPKVVLPKHLKKGGGGGTQLTTLCLFASPRQLPRRPGAPPVRCAPRVQGARCKGRAARAWSTGSRRRALQRPLQPPPRKTGRSDLAALDTGLL